MSSFGAVLDACVIVPAALRDTLIRAAAAGLYRVYWSEDILEEVRSTLVARGMTDETRAQKLVDTLRAYSPESLACGYENLVSSMTNDPGDRHVLAAAVATGSQVIVTANLRDFPDGALAPYGIEAQSPDTFLTDLFDLHPSLMIKILYEQAEDLRIRPMTFDQILETLSAHAPIFYRQIREHLLAP
jgi:predicted nucleic acid-binding protein